MASSFVGGPIVRVRSTPAPEENQSGPGFGSVSSIQLPGGDYLVFWGVIESGIDARHVSADGELIDQPFRVARTDFEDPTVALLPDGGFVITYAGPEVNPGSADADIFLKRYGPDGGPAGASERVNGATAGDQIGSDLLSLDDGRYVVVWSSSPGEGAGGGMVIGRPGVYLQVYEADGTKMGGQVTVAATGDNGILGNAAAAKLADGQFVVVWSDGGPDGAPGAGYARVFDADGNPLGPAAVLSPQPFAGEDERFSIANLEGGRFVVAGKRFLGTPPEDWTTAVSAQIFDGSLDAVSTVFTAPPGSYQPDVAPLPGGGFVLSWLEFGEFHDDGSRDQDRIMAREFDAAGSPVSEAFVLDQAIGIGSHDIKETDAGFVLTWTETDATRAAHVYMRQFAPGILFDDNANDRDLNALDPGDFWGQGATDAKDGDDVVTLPDSLAKWRVWGEEAVPTFHGGDGNDAITGGALDDAIQGEDGNDVLKGSGGNDTLDGGDDGYDTLDGGEHDDTLVAGPGDDELRGGSGADVFDYQTRGLSDYTPGAAQKLDGGEHPEVLGRYDLLKLPGNPSDYEVRVEFGPTEADTRTIIETGDKSGLPFVKLETTGIEKAVFQEPIDNVVGQGNVLLEMLRLADEVYGPQPTLSHTAEPLANMVGEAREEWSAGVTAAAQARNWHPLSAIELGIEPAGAGAGGLQYTLVGGHYQAVTPSQRFWKGDTPEANAIAMTGLVDGKKTLAIAFRGTDQIADFADYRDFSTQHYAKYRPLVDALDAFVADPQNGIQQILVSGHSLGAGMVQEFMAGHPGDARYKALTIGSPGSDNDFGKPDPRIVNFAHTDDAVARFAPPLSDPDQVGGTTKDALAKVVKAVGLATPLSGEDAAVLAGLVQNVQEKARQGSEVFISSDVYESSVVHKVGDRVPIVPSLGDPIAEHDRKLYFKSVAKMLEFAKDEQSPFHHDELARALRDGTIYTGGDIRIAVGNGNDPLDSRIRTGVGDDYVLGSSGGDRILWAPYESSPPVIDFRIIDGGAGTDALVLPGLKGLWDWGKASEEDTTWRLSYGGALVASLARVEKLVFPQWLARDEELGDTSAAATMSGEAVRTAAALEPPFTASADATEFDGPVVNLDGTPVSVQTPDRGQTTLAVDGSFDYTDAGDGAMTVAGSAGDDIVVYGVGQKTISGGGGHDIVIGKVAVASSSEIAIVGGGGDDSIIGGGGVETLVYAGARDDYTAIAKPDGSVEILDLREGSPDGRDHATDVEFFRFSDGTFTLDRLLADAGSLPEIIGTERSDRLSGKPEGDVIKGLGGNDRIEGLAGEDMLDGGNGNDRLKGGAGHDRLDGGIGRDGIGGHGGNDMLIDGSGNDRLDGGSGGDVAIFDGPMGGYRVTGRGTLWTVKDIDPNDGNLGTDTLVSVEYLLFDDVMFDTRTGRTMPVPNESEWTFV